MPKYPLSQKADPKSFNFSDVRVSKDHDFTSDNYDLQHTEHTIASKENSKHASIITERNQKTLDQIKDPSLKLRRSVERFAKEVDGILSKNMINNNKSHAKAKS